VTSKSTVFSETFLVNDFLENEEEDACTIDHETSVTQRLPFVCDIINNEVAVEAEPVKPQLSVKDEFIDDQASNDWGNVAVVLLWLLNAVQTLTDVILTKLKLQDTSEVLSSACALELMNVEFHSILTSMTRTLFALLIECSLACSVQSCITHILAINNDNSVRSVVLFMFVMHWRKSLWRNNTYFNSHFYLWTL